MTRLALILLLCAGCKPALILKCDGCYIHEADVEQANVQTMESTKEEANGK